MKKKQSKQESLKSLKRLLETLGETKTEPVETNEKRRFVSNEEYEAAWKNEDNRNMIRSETLAYAKQLDENSLDSCGMQGLWKALQYHRNDKGQKFTTSLWRFIHWECQRELRRVNRQKARERRLENDISELPESSLPLDVRCRTPGKFGPDNDAKDRSDNLSHIRDCMQKLPLKVRRVVYQHFFENRTMDEIGMANGYSKETARSRLAQGVSLLKEWCIDQPDEPVEV